MSALEISPDKVSDQNKRGKNIKIYPMYYVVLVISTAQCPRMDLNKSPYPDQRLPQQENLYPIGQFLLILDLWGVSFHAAVVFGLSKDFLLKSILGHCVGWNFSKGPAA